MKGKPWAVDCHILYWADTVISQNEIKLMFKVTEKLPYFIHIFVTVLLQPAYNHCNKNKRNFLWETLF